MIAHAPEVNRHDNAHGCGCGCGGTCTCESRCCDLQCLIRPNYFCGQTLTDRDLTALVEWARTRFALARYRSGWGAVCGLDITCTGPDAESCCGPEDGRGPAVYLNPGYAIDCCGNDLVVCDPMKVDLSSICVEYGDPCADLREDPPKGTRPEAGDTYDNYVDLGRDKAELDRLGAFVDPCRPWKNRSQLFAVDLSLRYHEDLTQGQRTMFRNRCADEQPCGYSRIIERPCVHLDVTTDLRATLLKREAEEWLTTFKTELREYVSELTALGQDPAEVLRYVRRHPPATLCFIEDYVCCAFDSPLNLRDRRWREQVNVWLLLDWILQRLRCQCGSCRPDSGVRIGRVLLRRIKVHGQVKCRVVMIDTGPRHRRELRKECRPLFPGAIDLAPYLWLPVDDVRDDLRSRGLEVANDSPLTGTALSNFTKGLIVLSAERGAHVRPLVTEDPLGARRIVAFAIGKL